MNTALLSLRRQWRPLRALMLLIYFPVLLALAIVVVARARTGIAIADFTVDPLIVVGGAPVYTGILSTIGGLIWAGTFAVCMFGYTVMRNVSKRNANGPFLLAGGFITLMLLMDDVFLFHEIISPRYLGVPQQLIYAIYVVIVSWFLVSFRRTILRTEFLLLTLALTGFGLSLLFDLTAEINPHPAQFLFEDGAKIFGLVSWAAYFVRVSARHVMSGQEVQGSAGRVHNGSTRVNRGSIAGTGLR
ncbi:MAG TPA: hypothetical protein VGR08_08795 [Thermomicrobiales bacterium]|nr:hypothetical protein [Thermomicrobiales bacterium]